MNLAVLTERYRGIIIGVAAVCILVAAYMVYRTFAGGYHLPNSNYYTIDDGKTWFADRADKYCPFEYKGKQAVRIHLFDCGGKVVPGYMEQLTPAAQETLAKAQGNAEAMRRARPVLFGGKEVKRPGDPAWHPLNSVEGSQATAVPCAADVANPEEVFP